MATITKDFKIKNGLIVEGSTATVNGNDVLTKSASDTTYIQGLVGGVANSEAVANAIVLRDANASFAANVVTADLVGDVTGTVSDISNHDTDSLAEGTTNKYFSNTLARDAFSAGTGITLSSGEISVTSGSYDSYGSADTAQTNAQNYADGLASNYDAAGSADTAQTNAVNIANLYTDNSLYPNGILQDPTFDLFGSASTAQTNAQNYADGLASNYDAAGSADTAQTNAVTIANAYTDDAVANLVNGAPELLDTLNELAAALDDNPNVIADLQDVAAGKQDTLTAGSGIEILGSTISVKGLDTDDIDEGSNLYFTDARARNAISGVGAIYYDNVSGEINVASGNFDAIGSADTAQTNAVTTANAYTDTEIDALTTDSIEEGVNNQYFSNSLARQAISGVGAIFYDNTTGEISVTSGSYDSYGSADTAQTNAVTTANAYTDTEIDALTTDDIEEGSSNLYFSNALAVSALEAVTPNFQSVDITWVRREEATWTDANTAGTHTAHAFSSSEGSVKYLVRIFNNGDSQVSEVLVTTDSSNNIAVLEYGTIYTSANPLATVTADWDSVNSEYRLRVTTANNNSEILVAATLVAYND